MHVHRQLPRRGAARRHLQLRMGGNSRHGPVRMWPSCAGPPCTAPLLRGRHAWDRHAWGRCARGAPALASSCSHPGGHGWLWHSGGAAVPPRAPMRGRDTIEIRPKPPIRRRLPPHRLLLPRRRDGRYLEARTRELPRAARQDGGAAGNLCAVVRPSLRLGGRCRAHGTIKRDKIRLLGFTRYTTSTLRSTAMLGPSLSHPDSLISLDKKDKIVLSDLFFLQPCKGT